MSCKTNIDLTNQASQYEYDGAPPVNAKKCTLLRSNTQKNNDCFLEPECQNVCTNKTNQVCTPYQEQECTETDVRSCNIITEEKCETVYETLQENDCSQTVEEKLCRDVVRNECKIVTETKCETR